MIAENQNSTNVFKKMDGEQLDFTKIDDQKIISLNDRELFSLCQKYGVPVQKFPKKKHKHTQAGNAKLSTFFRVYPCVHSFSRFPPSPNQ